MPKIKHQQERSVQSRPVYQLREFFTVTVYTNLNKPLAALLYLLSGNLTEQ